MCAIAILNRGKWELAKGNLEEYKKMGGGIFEGTNDEVAQYPKFLAIFDKISDVIKPKTEKEKKSRTIKRNLDEMAKKAKKISKKIEKLVKKSKKK